MAQDKMERAHGSNLSEQQRNQFVATEFNVNHLKAGGAGFGGKMSPRRVEQEGMRRAQMMVGSRIPQPQQMHLHPLPLTEIDLAVGQRKLRDLCKRCGESAHGTTEQLRKRLRRRHNPFEPSPAPGIASVSAEDATASAATETLATAIPVEDVGAHTAVEVDDIIDEVIEKVVNDPCYDGKNGE